MDDGYNPHDDIISRLILHFPQQKTFTTRPLNIKSRALQVVHYQHNKIYQVLLINKQ